MSSTNNTGQNRPSTDFLEGFAEGVKRGLGLADDDGADPRQCPVRPAPTTLPLAGTEPARPAPAPLTGDEDDI